MQAFILCAGKSTRTYPLTVDHPKPLLKVMNKTILEHNLDALKGIVKEVTLVVGFKKEMIRKAVKGYKGLKISYVLQRQQKGTGDAIKSFSKKVKGPFMLIMGDNIYSKQDLARLAKKKDALLGQKVKHPEQFGVLKVGKRKGKKALLSIDEKPKKAKGKLINSAGYVFGKEILQGIKDMKRSSRGEWEMTDMINAYAKETLIEVVEAKGVHHITYPWDLLSVNEHFVKKAKNSIKGKVDKRATVKGTLIVGKGTVIKSGVHIEGPVVIGEGCNIGPNCYLRAGTVIGDNCKVGNAVELKNSILFDHVSVGHLSYMGDTIISNNTNIGAGTITANLRHDNADIKSSVNGKLIDTGRRKLGGIIGSHVHTGIHTSILPGRKLWPKTSTNPGEVIKKDVM